VNAGTCRQSRQLPSTTGVVLAWGRSRLRRCTLIRDLRAPWRDNSQSSAFNRPGYIGVQKESSDVSWSVGARLRYRANLRAGPRIAG
jgi:hypothetical protein